MPKADSSLVELFRLIKPELSCLEYQPDKHRLLLRLNNSDYFLVDRSSKVPDGVRVAFVVDLDVKSSSRRADYESQLRASSSEVERILGCPVVFHEKLEATASTGQLKWCKIQKHSRMGVHIIIREPNADWSVRADAYRMIHPLVSESIGRLCSLVESFPPPQEVK